MRKRIFCLLCIVGLLCGDLSTRVFGGNIFLAPPISQSSNEGIADGLKGVNNNFFYEERKYGAGFIPEDDLFLSIKSVEEIAVPRITTENEDNRPIASRIPELIHVHGIVACHLYKWVNDTGNKFTKEQADGEAAHWYELYYNALTWLLAEIVNGEGERDEAPMLYVGQRVGGGFFVISEGKNMKPIGLIFEKGREPQIAIGIDVLELTNGMHKKAIKCSCSPAAYSEMGGLMSAPDLCYFYTWAVGPAVDKTNENLRPDLNLSVQENLRRTALRRGKKISELKGGELLRERQIRHIVQLIKNGIFFNSKKDPELVKICDIISELDELIPNELIDLEATDNEKFLSKLKRDKAQKYTNLKRQLEEEYKKMDKKVQAVGIYWSGNLMLNSDGSLMPTINFLKE
ncbi:MAG: fructose-bisphosphatase class II [bacterium]